MQIGVNSLIQPFFKKLTVKEPKEREEQDRSRTRWENGGEMAGKWRENGGKDQKMGVRETSQPKK